MGVLSALEPFPVGSGGDGWLSIKHAVVDDGE